MEKELNETNKILLFAKNFFDKRKVKYVITVNDENKITVSVRE